MSSTFGRPENTPRCRRRPVSPAPPAPGTGEGLALSGRSFGARRQPAGSAPQPDLLGEFRAARGVVWRNHRIIRREPPFYTVFVRRHIIGRPQVPLQHLQFLAVLEADKEFRSYRFSNRHRGLRRLKLWLRHLTLEPF